ncbi:MAG: hypothetical protein TYPL_3180 [Candidatus Tyloplasma litorale]|nr:MAG: hypothetical protein TYPL_3180 [Mycoplasmatales bacterium]
MNYNFEKMANKQKELDHFIRSNSIDKINNEKYFNYRIIALSVEISELVNEIRFFKFWSQKKPSEKKIIINELVDCFHFAFSVGNTLQNNEWKINFNLDEKDSFENIYFNLQENLIKLKESKNLKTFYKIMMDITKIAWNLNYSQKDIEEAYKIKNEINYKRQNSGY